jgi:2-dehydro-3-deoxygluconokinase
MKKTVTFGEIMVRVCPPGFERFRQAMPGSVDVTFAGAEANVAVSLAYFGGQAAFVTALPEHLVADACIGNLRSYGVDVSGIQRVAEGRLGLYYVERGANQRPGRVIYDRAFASVAVTPPERYPWEKILAGAGWFHFTGITPALSENAAACCLDAVRKAKEHGVTVSCDLNFRSKLWNWKPGRRGSELAGEVMRGLLPYVDLLIANESDAADVLGIHAGASDVDRGKLELDRYPEVAAKIVSEFPGIRQVAITLRESLSATHNNWGAMLYEARGCKATFAPLDREGTYRPYEIRNIVDRVGAGDSFGAALIFALQTAALSEASNAIGFAAAASCLAHSVEGDFNLNTRSEVEALLGGSASGRVIR